MYMSQSEIGDRYTLTAVLYVYFNYKNFYLWEKNVVFKV